MRATWRPTVVQYSRSHVLVTLLWCGHICARSHPQADDSDDLFVGPEVDDLEVLAAFDGEISQPDDIFGSAVQASPEVPASGIAGNTAGG